MVFFSIILYLILSVTNANYEVTIVDTKVHDKNCFTQGLLIDNNFLYESCGLYKESLIKKLDLESFKVLFTYNLPYEVFVEGITIIDNLLYALTWKNNNVYILNKDNLDLIKIIPYDRDGWGITHNPNGLIYTSDGSSNIYTYNTKFQLLNQIQIKEQSTNKTVKHINELEYIDGFIYANIWLHDYIIKINITNGLFEKIDFKHLLYPRIRRKSKDECMNGIAYNTASKLFLLTGKFWPNYYYVDIKNKLNNYHKRELIT